MVCGKWDLVWLLLRQGLARGRAVACAGRPYRFLFALQGLQVGLCICLWFWESAVVNQLALPAAGLCGHVRYGGTCLFASALVTLVSCMWSPAGKGEARCPVLSRQAPCLHAKVAPPATWSPR